MEKKFSFLYHHHSKQMRSPIPQDSSKWPEEWHTIYYKTYPRLPNITLDDVNANYDMFSAITERSSNTLFSSKPITKKELSIILKYSAGLKKQGSTKRVYPSAGARYPIELYLLVLKTSDKIPRGLYHYDVENHRLNVLWSGNKMDKKINELFYKGWYMNASVIIFMTSVFWRSERKYGERSYRFVLLEAGHINQNIYLVSEALSLKCCSVGGKMAKLPEEDGAIEQFLDIDGMSESLVSTIALGK